MATLELDLTCRLRDFALDLSLALGDEVVALAGPSGAGKTTVLRCVAGLRSPDAGRIACGAETWFEHAEGYLGAQGNRTLLAHAINVGELHVSVTRMYDNNLVTWRNAAGQE